MDVTRVRELVDGGKGLDEVKEALGVVDDAERRWPAREEVIFGEMTGAGE